MMLIIITTANTYSIDCVPGTILIVYIYIYIYTHTHRYKYILCIPVNECVYICIHTHTHTFTYTILLNPYFNPTKLTCIYQKRKGQQREAKKLTQVLEPADGRSEI